MRNRAVTVADLRHPAVQAASPRAVLLCDTCGERNSAHAGDYWLASPDHVFKHCRRNMRLVVPQMVYQDVSLD